jgi:glucose/arabinose dehydrogenase
VRTCDRKDGVVRIMYLFRVIITVAMAAIPSMTTAQIQLSPIATGLSSPVFVGNAGDGSGRLFIVEQSGIIKVLLPGGAPTVFLDIRSRVLSGGERGLLGLAFHPLYSTNGRLFVFYTQNPDGARMKPSRRRYGNMAQLIHTPISEYEDND